MTTGISLIIPTYNRAEFLSGTLDSVAALHIPAGVDVELLVIDNNCTDNTADLVAHGAGALPFPVRHIIESQQGLCFGRNRGIAEARYEHLGYLDDDIRVAADWIRGYFEAVNEYGADAVVGPVFPLFLQEKPQYLQGKVLDGICSPYSRRGDEILVLPERSAHELPGCNFGVTRAAAREVQGFDNRLDRVGNQLLAGGDFDFGHRLVRAGKRTVYHPSCSIEHIIIPEKLEKSYLRKRAVGTGMTMRVMQNPGPISLRQRMRYLWAATNKAARSLALKLTGRTTEAFDLELQALTNWGFLRGRT